MQTYAARPADRRAGRIHFKGERESRRRQILAAILELPVSVRIYSSDLRYELDAQQACLAKLVSDIAAASASRLVIERDDSMVRHDRRTLIEAVAKAGCRDRLRYDHYGQTRTVCCGYQMRSPGAGRREAAGAAKSSRSSSRSSKCPKMREPGSPAIAAGCRVYDFAGLLPRATLILPDTRGAFNRFHWLRVCPRGQRLPIAGQ